MSSSVLMTALPEAALATPTTSVQVVDDVVLPQPLIPEPPALSPGMLRKALQSIETEFQVNRSELLQHLYLETRRTPMARVIFEHYKSSDLTIDPSAIHRLCYDFGVLSAAQNTADGVRKYASLPGSTMIYQDFLQWWQAREDIRCVPFLSVRLILFTVYSFSL